MIVTLKGQRQVVTSRAPPSPHSWPYQTAGSGSSPVESTGMPPGGFDDSLLDEVSFLHSLVNRSINWTSLE